MKISILSKIEMMGGSEFRCIELANGLSRIGKNEAFILAEKSVPKELFQHISSDVTVVENYLDNLDHLYDSDCIIVVNTDVKEFSTLDYWAGKTSRHNVHLDIDRLKNKKMFFLYNFLISPSRNLYQLADVGLDVRILATNKKFFDEITKQDRYELVRSLPRHILVSPIDPNKLNIFTREPKDTICFGMHSKRVGNKWNDEFLKLITEINKRDANKVQFRFMGIKDDLKKKLEKISNVTCLKENEETVKDFLSKVDVFLFMPDWKREEPWARVIAEAMVSGCPIIALDRGGTSDQVLSCNNGFLCKKYEDYYKSVIYFVEHAERISVMSRNSIRIARRFYTKAVVENLLNLVEN